MASEAQRAKAEAFLRLHHGPDLVILPNVWDAAGARIVAAAGYPALATTSAGIAFALGYPDGQRMSRDENLATVRRIAAAVDLPVTADLEAGYGDVAATVTAAIEAGAIGMNLEDGTEDPARPLVEFGEAEARVRAARQAAEAAGLHFVINGRTDAFLFGRKDLPAATAEAIRRGNAYLAAGADCVFVPFIEIGEVIAELVEGIRGPLNVLAMPGSPPPGELKRLGVARLSTGGGIARAAYGLLRRTAVALRGEAGGYDYQELAMSHAELDALLGKP